MSRRELSMKPSAIRARDQRLNAWIAREEERFNAEVKEFMDRGLTFEEAWVSAGGQIVPLCTEGLSQ